MTTSPISPAQLQRRAIACLLLGAACIALAPIFVRVSEVPPTATAFYRLAFAFPVLLLMARPRRERPPSTPAFRGWGWAALAGLAFAGDLGFWHTSIHFTSVANATLLANLAPIGVTLVAWLALGERVDRLFILGLAMALTGATLLMRASIDFGARHLLGDLFGVVTAAFYAAYLLSVKLARRTLGTGALMSAATLVGAVALAPAALALEGFHAPQTLRGWSILVGLGLVSHVGGQGLIAYGLAHLPASFSSVVLLVQPGLAAALAWLLFGEALTAWQALGGVAVLAGILLARKATAAW